MTVRFGLCRPPRIDDRFVEWVSAAERAGSAVLGFGDSQTMWPDTYVGLTLAAEHSERMRIGPWVTVPVTRHPTVAASAIAAIQRLSGGRAFFGIGPGDSSLINIGEAPVRMAEFEEYALAVRDLCAGREARYHGQTLAMHWDVAPVPLWIAGDGPRMLELAGRIGDGVIVGNAATPELVEFARRHIAAGAASAGRGIEDLEVWYMTRIHVSPTAAQGVTELEFYLASYANVRFRKSMRDKGVPVDDDTAERITAFRREFDPSRAYSASKTYNVALLEKHGLKQWLADQFLVTGPIEEIRARLDALIAAGARNFAVPQMLDDPLATTAQVASVFASFS